MQKNSKMSPVFERFNMELQRLLTWNNGEEIQNQKDLSSIFSKFFELPFTSYPAVLYPNQDLFSSLGFTILSF